MIRALPGCRTVGGGRAEAMARARDTFLDVFRSFGYRLFFPSGLQSLEDVWPRVTPAFRRRLVTLLSPGGEPCCLRGDLTLAAVAHLVAHHEPHERPLRLCYADRVYRIPGDSGEPLERFQVGAELLGWEGQGADAELLALLMRSLARMGATGCTAVLGDVTLVEEALEALPAPIGAALGEALRRQDLTTYQGIMARAELPAERRPLLEELPWLKGDRTVLDRAVRLGVAPSRVAPLHFLAETLESLECGTDLRFDLALFRELGYYSGPVFEIYAPRGGRPLGGGGRYDGLLASHGLLGQALGVALDLEALAEATLEKKEGRPGVMVWGSSGTSAHTMKVAELLVGRGWTVELSWSEDATASRSLARVKKFRWWVDGAAESVTFLRNSHTVPLERWLAKPEDQGEDGSC